MAGAIDLSQFNSYEEMVIATGQAAAKAALELDKLRQGVERAVTQSFKQLSIAIAGLVTAGLQGTQEAGRLSIAWMLLTRQIASVFLPIIDAFTRGMRRLSDYMATLTGDGQRVAMIFGSLAVVAPVLARAFSLFYGIFSPIYVALGMVIEAMYEFFTQTVEGQAIMSAIGAVMEYVTPVMKAFQTVFEVIVDALVVAFQAIVRSLTWVVIKIASLVETILDWIPGLGDAAESVKKFKENAQANLDNAMAQGWGIKKGIDGGAGAKQRRDVSPNNYRFEAIGAAMERITLAANKTGADPIKIAQEQLAAQQAIAKGVDGVKDAVIRQNPVVAR